MMEISINKECIPMVFISSPYAGLVDKNVKNARHYCKYAVEQGAIPITPHLFFPQFMDDSNPEQRRQAIEMGLELLTMCQELWCFGEHISVGMKIELNRAKELNIPIRHFTKDCMEVIGNERT